jgi:hypothetical protein
LQSLKDRGIDASLEVREVEPTSVDSFENQYPEQKIYARLSQPLDDFERKLGTLSDAKLDDLIQTQE